MCNISLQSSEKGLIEYVISKNSINTITKSGVDIFGILLARYLAILFLRIQTRLLEKKYRIFIIDRDIGNYM